LFQGPGKPFHGTVKMVSEKKGKSDRVQTVGRDQGKVKFEVFGEEMVEKTVKLSGNSGRVYLPPDWVGCTVKIIRID
jgi:putative transposon-encoded protein